MIKEEVVKKYNEIIERYRNGDFGEDHLYLNEILERAGEPDLLKELDSSEILCLVKRHNIDVD